MMRQTEIFSRKSLIIQEKFNILLKRPEFQEDIATLRKQWGIKIGEKTNLVESKDGDLDFLLKKYRLNKEWENLLSIYIIENTFEPRYDPEGPQFIIEDSSDGIDILESQKQSKEIKDRAYYIRIYPSTTEQQLMDVFRKAKKEMTKGVKIKLRPSPKIDKFQYASELQKQGKSYSEIMKYVQEVYGEVMGPGALKSGVARYRKREMK